METLRTNEQGDSAQGLMDLSGMTTERENPASLDIDAKGTREILAIINEEDKKVPFAVEAALDDIAALVDDVVASFVITSYSIHYTKLYEGVHDRADADGQRGGRHRGGVAAEEAGVDRSGVAGQGLNAGPRR